MPRSPVCVDANIVVKLVAPEPDRPLALALWGKWLNEDREIVAPYLFCFEITSAIWRKAKRGLMSVEEAKEAVRGALMLGVRLLHPSNISLKAFDLAARFDRPAAYDTHYLALAEMMEGEFWTADERLYNTVRDDFSRIHWLGDYQ
ncbi:MAG: type II toxin-antitoxin system VapC family toxin [Anaerolineae bacterium]